MKIIKRKRFRYVLFFLCLPILAFIFPSWTPRIRDESRALLPNSVSTLEQIELGGIKQSVLIRGNDQRNPILLFIHGGPGYSQIAYARQYQRDLEKDFIVVNWDQRGSGKSYHWNLTHEDLQIGNLVEDTLELTEYLEHKFSQPKIFIVGHSWGSMLATLTVQQFPEHFYAYIGIGQVADAPFGEHLSYQFALDEARKRNNAEAVKELKSIGPPPYKDYSKVTRLEQKWITDFGGAERKSHTQKELLKGILLAPEYTWSDGIRMAFGSRLSKNAILPQIQYSNFFKTVPALSIPVYLCMGRYDYITPSEDAYNYYEKLDAPEKLFIWFEESAHFPHFEEMEKFHTIMITIKEKALVASH